MRHKPSEESRKNVRRLAGVGLTHLQIAAFLGVSRPTLERQYAIELSEGRVSAIATVAKTLYQKAVIEKHVGACMFYLKHVAGWGEREEAADVNEDEEREVAPSANANDEVAPTRSEEPAATVSNVRRLWPRPGQ